MAAAGLMEPPITTTIARLPLDDERGDTLSRFALLLPPNIVGKTPAQDETLAPIPVPRSMPDGRLLRPNLSTDIWRQLCCWLLSPFMKEQQQRHCAACRLQCSAAQREFTATPPCDGPRAVSEQVKMRTGGVSCVSSTPKHRLWFVVSVVHFAEETEREISHSIASFSSSRLGRPRSLLPSSVPLC